MAIRKHSIVALVMAAVTAGAGTALGAMVSSAMTTLAASTTAGVTMGAMAEAGFATLASQAAVSLVSNKGDVGKVFKDLGRKENLRALATEVAVARLVGMPNKPEGFMQRLTQEAVNSGARTLVDIAQEKNVGKAVTEGVINTAVNTTGDYAAEKVGDAYHGKPGEAPFRLRKDSPIWSTKGPIWGLG